MIDILFTSVPYTETDQPIMAPGLLKSIAKSAGYSAQAIDLNIEIVPKISQDPESGKIAEFLLHNNLSPDIFEKLIALLDYAAERILSYQAKTVGLSLLTIHSQVFTYWLCVRLKSLSPHTQIIVGGPGIKHTIVSAKNEFCSDLQSRGLIDHYITGDGELALVEFLKRNYSYPGIDSLQWQQIQDIENFPYPDYDDYDFSQYQRPSIPITDSRGCVRECEFCDIIEHWTKFVYRSADSVFAEMQAQVERYGIYDFRFQNSLTNGNLREFRKLMSLIADYNSDRPRERQMSWGGYFIIRSQAQHPESLWEVMSKTNPFLALGVESVIQHVRWGLGKKFYNEDIDVHLEMAKKYKIKLGLLLIVGYPTETRDDYEFTKKWFKDRVEIYGYGDPVALINLSYPAILENTQLERNIDALEIKKGQYNTIWMSKKTNITPQERVNYYNELHAICQPFNPPKGVTPFGAPQKVSMMHRLEGYKTPGKIATQ